MSPIQAYKQFLPLSTQHNSHLASTTWHIQYIFPSSPPCPPSFPTGDVHPSSPSAACIASIDSAQFCFLVLHSSLTKTAVPLRGLDATFQHRDTQMHSIHNSHLPIPTHVYVYVRASLTGQTQLHILQSIERIHILYRCWNICNVYIFFVPRKISPSESRYIINFNLFLSWIHLFIYIFCSLILDFIAGYFIFFWIFDIFFFRILGD